MNEDEVQHLPEEEVPLEQQEQRIVSIEEDQFESADEAEIVDIEHRAPRRSPRIQRPATNNAQGQSSARRRAAQARTTAAQRVTAIQNAIRRSNGQDLEYKQKILRALTQITRSFEMVVEQQADGNLMFWQAIASESRYLRPALYTQFKTEVIDKLAEYIRLNQHTFESEM
ncbi:uncharacterized protein LOC128715283 [Anopheles marshallii]|uniref:uncharacterized protein LOC128715283 n=1 Tax=Anopheles marshallii TaxID=1521116 RepID=UPI00237BC01D|nr:uncharacterized protein LOC128715283 [Anopheles marshallii]